ncbi:hypothetical protein [Marivita hallyeonensis]|uniref:Uncharacterized protein n=1 Tax=Marivita hallyeonensis TaxID=996342 RepID=A0A1M5LW95_9RHOB|nr:hypothetical protein [Marivita hallyeonensis]SHG69276.1 hypothetical protein SAMN05443551_0303 [Marivita hallyeonensis]
MQITELPHWQRQKMVVIERLHNDLARFTAPIFHIVLFAAVIYLPCFALVMVGGAVPVGALAALLAISTVALVIASPAFALAISIEAYFQRQTVKMQRR